MRPRRGGTSFGDNRGDVLIITSAARTARNGNRDGAVIIMEFTVTYGHRHAHMPAAKTCTTGTGG